MSSYLAVTNNNEIACSDKLQSKLRGEGGIKALLGMVRCGHPDVLAQVARGIANFAKCESRASTQGKDASYGLWKRSSCACLQRVLCLSH